MEKEKRKDRKVEIEKERIEEMREKMQAKKIAQEMIERIERK